MNLIMRLLDKVTEVVLNSIFYLIFMVLGIFFWTIETTINVIRFIPTMLYGLERASVFIVRTVSALLVLSLVVYLLITSAKKDIDIERTTAELPSLNLSEVETNENQIYGPMIRLMSNGFFRCSATVISDTYALTAAHCITNSMGRMTRKTIVINSDDNQETGVTAVVVAMHKHHDVALLQGDFSEFKKVLVDTDPNGILIRTGPFKTCGFPGGDKAICVAFFPKSNNNFMIMGKGFLYEGMSGGPVIDTSTGLIVGVNSSVAGDAVNIGPLVGFFANIRLKVNDGNEN